MTKYAVLPTEHARTFGEDQIIVSKTDLKGRITYANEVFSEVSGFRESELLGQPHSIIRHPDMPRAVFKLLWDKVGVGEEVFAYVKNMCKNGDHYWVFAHVTPSRDEAGRIIGYHSNRRSPKSEQIVKIEPLYKSLLETEAGHKNAKQGLTASSEQLAAQLAETGMDYDAFIFTV